MRAYKRLLKLVVLGTAVSCLFASAAGAVVLRSANGQFFGAALRQGVSASSLAGVSVPVVRGATKPKSNGNVDYNGGPVLHSSAPYLIFWDPKAKIPASSEGVIKTYLTDVAADSGKPSDVYSVLRQYTDTQGFSDYSQTFSASQSIIDTKAYPTAGNCTAVAAAYPTCITDAQIHSELTRLISADGLPTGNGANAPIYFVITPQNVNICFDSGSICGNNAFCAYHSNYADGGHNVLYALVPFIVWALDHTKGCQTDGTAKYQTPHANGDHGYQIADNLSHELSETITDPNGDAWWNTYNGNGQEVGDICATYGPTPQPLNGLSPLAYAPTLGGTEPTGTLYDQLIHGDEYYNQSEWSNGNVNCRLRTSSGTIKPAFTGPTSAKVNKAVTFNPAGSTSTNGYSSTTWNLGDGSTTFGRSAPASVKHTYKKAGTYTVKLTLVDPMGNLATVSHTITIS